MTTVNNVGISLGLPNRFERISRKHIWALMMVNSSAAVSMTHQLLPKMKRNKKGLIVNISSASAHLPTPYANLYGSSKVTIESLHFTRPSFITNKIYFRFSLDGFLKRCASSAVAQEWKCKHCAPALLTQKFARKAMQACKLDYCFRHLRSLLLVQLPP
jgi:short chain dehydrogenase